MQCHDIIIYHLGCPQVGEGNFDCDDPHCLETHVTNIIRSSKEEPFDHFVVHKYPKISKVGTADPCTKSHASHQAIHNSILEDRVPKNSQPGTFGSQAALKHPKESQAGIHKEPSKDKCSMYVETPKYHFNYHQKGRANGYYSNPHQYNNVTNNSKELNKTTSLRLTKVNHSIKKPHDLGPSKAKHSSSRSAPKSKKMT